jgi:hypothetical protein
MGYLDNNSITVNAVLTKKGREILARNGALRITSFALSDDEIDYRLYNPNHPQGSAFYDVAIKNTPVFEPLTDQTQTLKYKLVTLPPGSTRIPTIQLGVQEIKTPSTFTKTITIEPSTNPSYNTTLGYTVILNDRNAGSIRGQGVSSDLASSIPSFIGDNLTVTSQVAVGKTFTFVPNNSLTGEINTTLTIVGNESGGSISIPVTITV